MKSILSTEKLVVPNGGECQFTYPDFNSMNRAQPGGLGVGDMMEPGLYLFGGSMKRRE